MSTRFRSISTLAAAALAGLLLFAAEAPASTRDASEQVLASRVIGGTDLLAALSQGRREQRVHRTAVELEANLRAGNRAEAYRQWQYLERTTRRWSEQGHNDRRVDFLVQHLSRDIAALGNHLARNGRVDNGHPHQHPSRKLPPGHAQDDSGLRRHRLVSEQVCIAARLDDRRACPKPQREVTLRIPEGATSLRGIHAEWRDFGRRAKAQVFLDGRLVWQSDVSKKWERESKIDLDLPLRRGAVLTIRSNGDPIWVKNVDVDLEHESRRHLKGDRWQRRY